MSYGIKNAVEDVRTILEANIGVSGTTPLLDMPIGKTGNPLIPGNTIMAIRRGSDSYARQQIQEFYDTFTIILDCIVENLDEEAATDALDILVDSTKQVLNDNPTLGGRVYDCDVTNVSWATIPLQEQGRLLATASITVAVKKYRLSQCAELG